MARKKKDNYSLGRRCGLKRTGKNGRKYRAKVSKAPDRWKAKKALCAVNRMMGLGKRLERRKRRKKDSEYEKKYNNKYLVNM